MISGALLLSQTKIILKQINELKKINKFNCLDFIYILFSRFYLNDKTGLITLFIKNFFLLLPVIYGLCML